MGAPTIEAALRIRVLALVVPTLLVVGSAPVAVTYYVFERADEGQAAHRAEAALRALHTELAEGDPLERSLSEVLTAADADGVRVAIQGEGAPAWRHTTRAVPASMLSLAGDACAQSRDEQGLPWVGCTARDPQFRSIAAVPVVSHTRVIVTLAEAMAAIVAVALAGMVLMVRFSVRSTTRSIAGLARWSEGILETDEPKAAPPADTTDVQQLSRAFDGLVHRLFEALARERASSAYVAHELRTPLTAIIAEVEQGIAAGGDERLARIRQDAVRLAGVIDAILALTAPPDRPLKTGVVNLADLVRDAAGEGTQVDAPDEALIEGDSHLLTLALRNLVENANKHGGRPAKLVRVTREEAWVRVAVVDDGPGLDEAAREKMFDRFWRSGRETSGKGIGLALVRVVAERHGGTATARANEDGPGLEVSMTLGPVLGWYAAKADPPER